MKEIRKEIVIYAPAARVWEHLTSSAKMAGWFLPNDFEAKVGHQFTLDCHEEGRIACVVKEVIPCRKLVYTFKAAEVAFETLVSFTLEESEKATRLTLVHSGWDQLKPEEAAIFAKFEQGWESHFLKRLKSVVEGGN